MLFSKDHGSSIPREIEGGLEVVARKLEAAKESPLDVQVAGNHYKSKAIQPVEYIAANNLNFLEGCIVKRITRWRDKDGIKDLEKIIHEVQLLIEMEQKYGWLRVKE